MGRRGDHEAEHCSPLTAHCPSAFCRLLTAFCLLPSAPRFLAKSNWTTSGSTNTVAESGAFTIAVANAAAKPASMGRGDFVSWAAI
jgi:hypothetical protein